MLGAFSNCELQPPCSRPLALALICYQIGGGPSWQIRLVRFFWA